MGVLRIYSKLDVDKIQTWQWIECKYEYNRFSVFHLAFLTGRCAMLSFTSATLPFMSDMLPIIY